MANLADNITRAKMRILAFTYYVTQNPRYNEREYDLAVDSALEQRSGLKYSSTKEAKIYKALTPLSFLDNTLYDRKYAHVLINGESGYLPIEKINLPKTYTQYINSINITAGINDFILKQGAPINIKLFGENKIYKNISYAIDYEINPNSKNYRTNLILCQNNKKPIDNNSIYISYRPKNMGVATTNTGKEFGYTFVHSKEYKQYDIYKKTSNESNLVKIACFGPQALTPTNHSLEAIDCFSSGKAKFQVFSEGDYYELSFTNIYLTRNNISNAFLNSPYAPEIKIDSNNISIESKNIFI